MSKCNEERRLQKIDNEIGRREFNLTVGNQHNRAVWETMPDSERTELQALLSAPNPLTSEQSQRIADLCQMFVGVSE